MISISTSEGAISTRSTERNESGFTLIELVLGLTLALILSLAVAPLWTSLQAGSVSEGDQTLLFLQERVAVGRFERDLRLASGAGSAFELTAPVIEATSSRVIFMAPAPGGSAPIVIEWEIVGGSLMRRWGNCPPTRAAALAGSSYRYHKTTVEGVHSGSYFSYVVDGKLMAAPGTEAELAAIEAVVLDLRATSDGARPPVRVVSEAWVGR